MVSQNSLWSPTGAIDCPFELADSRMEAAVSVENLFVKVLNCERCGGFFVFVKA
jgi:hypothetical protein